MTRAVFFRCFGSLVVALLCACDAKDPRPPCFPDHKSAQYRECHHLTASGDCAHPGASCPIIWPEGPISPAPCWFDPKLGEYRRCLHVTANGECAHLAARCPSPTR